MFTSQLITALAVGLGALVAQVSCETFAPDLTWISENSSLPKVVYVNGVYLP